MNFSNSSPYCKINYLIHHPTIPQCLVSYLPLLAAGTLAAADFHVSPGGNDRHPGKPDLPAMIEALKTNPDHYELTPEQILEL